jgi:hypothetical protein
MIEARIGKRPIMSTTAAPPGFIYKLKHRNEVAEGTMAWAEIGRRFVKAYFVKYTLAFGSGVTKWRDVEHLQKLGITHVINLRRNTHNRKV